MKLTGKTAVVTAAGQGIGRAIAERFLAEGAEVFASDLNVDLLKTLNGCHTCALDATDFIAVKNYLSGMGTIDVLAHAVGFVHQGTIEECDPKSWQKSIDITLTSAYNVLHNAMPKMRRNGGSIITIASVVGSIKGFPKRAAYGAAKGGVIGLTKAIAADYIKEGIRCNAVCPGTVDSPSLRDRINELAIKMGSKDEALKFFMDRQPSGRFGTVEEIASVCAFLASDEAKLFTGQTIAPDGGITI